MVFRDGSHIDDVYYTGGRDITIKTYFGRDDEPDAVLAADGREPIHVRQEGAAAAVR